MNSEIHDALRTIIGVGGMIFVAAGLLSPFYTKSNAEKEREEIDARAKVRRERLKKLAAGYSKR
ncbi:MAG: hypothetical protein WDM81_19540 [Rhizomicrobium sp.]